MSTIEPESSDIDAQCEAAYKRMRAYWDAKVNEEDGSFETVIGDPTQTPCTSLAQYSSPMVALEYGMDM